MKVLTVVGARPQFIKAAPVSKALREAGHTEYLVHTGQHYDHNMSQIFFEEMQIPIPDSNLNIGSGSHGKQTGQMIIGIEKTIVDQKPDWLLIYGDTNSTLAGALAAVKLHVPVAHVEAGLRSFNRHMPEEHNRVLTDHCSNLLFCPTQTALEHLNSEGITEGVHLVGDTMYDTVLQFGEIATRSSNILNDLKLTSKQYLLATVHRPNNTDIIENMSSILGAFCEVNEPIVFPLHPRTRRALAALDSKDTAKLQHSNVHIIEPVGYLDMLMLEKHARLILTDSGGIQKEAYFFGVPCMTLRSETEWPETVKTGWNVLVEADRSKIIDTILQHRWPDSSPVPLFGDGQASQAIAQILQQQSVF